MKKIFLLIFALTACSLLAQARLSTIVKQELQEKILPKTSKTPIYTTLYNELSNADIACDIAWTQISSPKEYDDYRAKMRKNLIKALGGFPVRTPLNAKTVKRIKRKNYTIEKIIFQSQPGLYVTGLLFLPNPDKFKAPYPGIIVPCGHSVEGKGAYFYQRGCVIAAAPESINNILTVQNAPLSWYNAVKTSANYPFANIVNGALKHYD